LFALEINVGSSTISFSYNIFLIYKNVNMLYVFDKNKENVFVSISAFLKDDGSINVPLICVSFHDSF